MNELLLNERVIGGKDWATILFVLCFVLIAVNRTAYETRFAEFVKLAWSDKYTKIYKEGSNLMSGFTISFFFIQLVSFAFLIQFFLSYFDIVEKYSWISFIQIFTLVAVFILSKFLIEKIIATSFNIEEFNEQFNLHKVNYRTYIGMLLLPVNIILFYNEPPHIIVLWIIIGLIVLTSVVSYLISLRQSCLLQ